MKRLLLLGAAAVFAATASPVQAEGAYAGVEGGLLLQRALNYDFVGLSDFFSTRYAKGYDVAGKLGYDFEGIRVEAEISYKRAATNRFGFQVGNQSFLVERGSSVTGNSNTFAGMLNGYWDITQGRFQPYIGAGAGIARVASDKVGYSGYGSSGIFLNSSDTAFAFQLMAGLKARLTQHVHANVGYKYFDVEKVSLPAFNTKAKTSLHSSSIVAGITYNFGRSSSDSPPPPRPPEVATFPTETVAEVLPAPAIPASLTIGFAKGSAKLADDTKVSLDQIATAYKQVGRGAVMINGPMGDDGPVAFNDKLASLRAETTKSYLVAQGIPVAAISIQSLDQISGPVASKTSATPSTPPTLSISFGPGSGS